MHIGNPHPRHTSNSDGTNIAMSVIQFVLSKMNDQIGNVNVQKESCTFLINLAKHYPRELLNTGAISSIITAMSKHIDDAYMQMSGCQVLGTLCHTYDDDSEDDGVNTTKFREQITECGGIEAIWIAMSKHSNVEGIQELGTIAFWTFLSQANSDNVARITNIGGIDVVKSSMLKYKHNDNIQRVGRHVLIRLQPYDVPIQDILQRMKLHLLNNQVQKDCCDELLNLAGSTSRPPSDIVRAGGINAIVTAISHHPHNIDILVQCMKVIVLLEGNFDLPDEHAKVEFAKADIVESIVTAMHNNVDVELIQEWGFRSLWTFVHEPRAILLASLDVVETALSFRVSIWRHPNNSIIQDLGTHVMIRLAPCSIEVEEILQRMKENGNYVEIQKKCCAELGTLSTTFQSSEIIRLGGVEIISKAMSQHPSNIEIQKYGCIVFSNLTLTEIDLEDILNENIIKVIMDAMSSHLDVEVVQRSGFTVLSTLSAENFDRLITMIGDVDTAIGTFEKCLSRHPDIARIQMLGSHLLMRLRSKEMGTSLPSH